MPCGMAGTIIAQGQNTVSTGELKVKTYRLETTYHNFGTQIVKLFCLTVSLDYRPNASYLIWINEDPRAAYMMRKKGELTASFPLQWLDDGAAISVSESSKPYDVTTLPEKLQLPESVVQLQKSKPDWWTKITSMRRVIHTVDDAPKTFVEVEIISSGELRVGGQGWVLQIGKKEFGCGDPQNAHKLSCLLTTEEFDQLKDGDLVRVNLGYGALRYGTAGKSFARLDKSMIDKQQ